MAALVMFRRAVRARSRKTAAVAVSRAAPTAIRVICHPGMPPTTTVSVTGPGKELAAKAVILITPEHAVGQRVWPQ